MVDVELAGRPGRVGTAVQSDPMVFQGDTAS